MRASQLAYWVLPRGMVSSVCLGEGDVCMMAVDGFTDHPVI